MSKEAMKQALDFLRSGHFTYPTKIADDLEEALAKQEQGEPVTWESVLGAVARGWCYEENANKTMDSELAVAIAKEVHALYTTPQPKQEQGEPVAHINQNGVIHEAGYPWGANNTLEPLYRHLPQQRKPLTDEQKLDLVTNWFSDDWAIEYALNLLHDYEIKAAHGIKE